MGLYALIALIAGGSMMALERWRLGLYAMVLITAVQDPVRKSVPGAPGYLVLATAVVLLVVVVSLMTHRRDWWSSVARSFPPIDRAARILIVAWLPAVLISATYGPGSWILTLLGIVSYGTILMSIVVGYHFPRNLEDIRRFLGFYCIVSSVMLTGGVIEYLGLWPDSVLIGTEAMKMDWIRHGSGYIVNMIAGFYRSPDIMGWHAAATAMLSIILAMTGRVTTRTIWIGIGLFALFALLLCGRRKMVYMIPAFVVAVSALQLLSGGHKKFITRIGVVLLPLAGLWIGQVWMGEDAEQIRYYTDNPEDTSAQLQRHGYDALITTYRQAGFFGSGMGVATPGSHLLSVARPRVWQESGPSRVLVELGVPGMLALMFLLVTIIRLAWKVTRKHLRAGSPVAGYAVGLFAFFLANISGLVVSGQILAEPFAAAFLGLSIGMVLAFGRVPTKLPVVVRPIDHASVPAAYRGADGPGY